MKPEFARKYDSILKATGDEEQAQAYVDRLAKAPYPKKGFKSSEELPFEIKALPQPYEIFWMYTYNAGVKSHKPNDASNYAWKKVKRHIYKSKSGTWRMKTKAKSNSPGYFKATFFGKVAKEDDGHHYISGKASDTSVDLEDDHMSSGFIQKMIATGEGLTLFMDHQYTMDKAIGTLVQTWGDDNNFHIKARLQNPYDVETQKGSREVSQLIEKSEAGIKIGFSIGGRILTAVKSYSKELGRATRELVDGVLCEVSTTCMPANTNSEATVGFGKSLSKALDQMEEEGMLTEDGKNVVRLPAELIKVLDEAMEADNLWETIYDMTWTYKRLISNIVFNFEMTADTKKAKIQQLSDEFANKVAELSEALADAIEEELDFITADAA